MFYSSFCYLNVKSIWNFSLCVSVLKLNFSLVKLFHAIKMEIGFSSYQCIVFIHYVISMEFISRVSLRSSKFITPIESATRLARNKIKCIDTLGFLLVSSNYLSRCKGQSPRSNIVQWNSRQYFQHGSFNTNLGTLPFFKSNVASRGLNQCLLYLRPEGCDVGLEWRQWPCGHDIVL